MLAHGLTPILNISDFAASIEWFERLGWKMKWDWSASPGGPPTFGCVASGVCEVFLCQNGQGGRGRSTLTTTRPNDGADLGVWMTVWVEDVDAVHAHCLSNGIEITHPPTNEPWNVREMHIRHPDGHVFRISRGIPCV